MSPGRTRSVLLSAATLVLLGGSLLQGGGAYAADTASKQAATEQSAAAAVLAASPTDVQVHGASDAQLVRLAVRCVPIEGMTYCLHHGWDSEGVNSSSLVAVRSGATAKESQATGDMPLVTALRLWSQKPYNERLAGEQQELAEARAAAGKVMLMNHAILGTRLPSDFTSRYPDFASAASRIDAGLSVSTTGDTAGMISNSTGSNCDNISSYDCAFLMSESRMEKQIYGYYCGPTSLQALVWNDPKAPAYHSQSYWANILHTNQNGSTWIYDLKNAINTYTHWDDSDYAGTYIVANITNWTDSNYRNLFRTHFKTLRSPVQLHPKLIWQTTSTYYMGTTDGHFDVGRGYDYSFGDWVEIFEPAGASGAYPPLTAWETTPYVRKAQYANTGQRDISY